MEASTLHHASLRGSEKTCQKVIRTASIPHSVPSRNSREMTLARPFRTILFRLP